MKMKTLLILASSSLLLAGCDTVRITDYQPVSPSISERTVQDSGVKVALDPFVESERTRKYFDINAVANGIAILHVRVMNNTSDQTFLVEKKNFELVLAGASSGQNADSQAIQRSKAGGEAVGWAAATAGSLPLIVLASSMISSSMEIQRNFVGKEMPDQTLAPGQNMEGFIYYRPVPKDGGWSRGATIKIKLTETKSHVPVSLTILLSQ